MWVQCALLLVFLQFWLLFGPPKRKGRLDARITELGIVDILKAGAFVVTHSWIPNYEMGDRMRKIYGNVFVLKIPLYNSLVQIADLDLAKRLMSSSEWVNKYWDSHYLYSASFKKPIGLLFSNGEDWKEARKLTVKLLHQLEFYKPSTMEKFISFEMAEVEQVLSEKISENGGQVTFSPHQMFERSALNIVCQVIMGKRFERNDPIAEKILSTANAANREFNPGCSVIDVIPWLRHVDAVKPKD